MFKAYKNSLCGIMLSFLWSKYLVVQCLNQMSEVCLTLKKKKQKHYQTVLQSAYAVFHLHQQYNENFGSSAILQIPSLFNSKHPNAIVSYHGFHLCCLNY